MCTCSFRYSVTPVGPSTTWLPVHGPFGARRWTRKPSRSIGSARLELWNYFAFSAQRVWFVQRTGGFQKYEDPGRYVLDQAPTSVAFISGMYVMFWFAVPYRGRFLAPTEADRFASGAAEAEKRARDLEASRKAQEILRKREEVLHARAVLIVMTLW